LKFQEDEGIPPGMEAWFIPRTKEEVQAILLASFQPEVYRWQRKIREAFNPNSVGHRLFKCLSNPRNKIGILIRLRPEIIIVWSTPTYFYTSGIFSSSLARAVKKSLLNNPSLMASFISSKKRASSSIGGRCPHFILPPVLDVDIQ
jgi:hypothetical protein